MGDGAIVIKDLRKVYRVGEEKVVALSKINLTVPKGQICCIFGTSGSGKSTLLNQIAGFEKPTKGEIYIDGTDICKMNENQLAAFRQKNIGFIFQSYNLLQSLTALENVCLPMQFQGMKKSERSKKGIRMLAKVGLKGRSQHRPNQMSGGQQQRVGIARAFAANPKIIFADEPTGNLDSKTTVEVMEMMVEMTKKSKQTLLLVTHDDVMAHYADRIVTLIDGKIVSDVMTEKKEGTGSVVEDISAQTVVGEAMQNINEPNKE